VQANKCPSGEKASDWGVTFVWLAGSLRSDTLAKVVESWIPILSLKQTAMNLPHGDQAAPLTSVIPPWDAVHESHESGIPFTILAAGEQSWPYSF